MHRSCLYIICPGDSGPKGIAQGSVKFKILRTYIMFERIKLHKYIAICAIACYGSMALAQVTTPTGANSVYIEQIGNSNNILIEQVGNANNIGGTASTTPSSSNYGTIIGNSNSLTIRQTGDGNLSQYNIKGTDNIYSLVITGSGNMTKLNAGDANTNNLRNSVTETIIGDTNTVTQTLVGNDITSTLAITGNTNIVNKEIKSSNASSTVTIMGNNNTLDVQQTDIAGAQGHLLTQSIAGDFNVITTQQQGTIDTNVNIVTTGNSNQVVVRTSSTAIVNPR